MEFSKRTAWEEAEGGFAEASATAKGTGRELIDLTVANPRQCGFAQDPATLLAPLSDSAAAVYEPTPFGMVSAREAVAQYYADQGTVVAAEDICLTTSTSEGYSYLFRLLCDPGDEVLVASPSYPLFEFIARLDGVVLREYPLRFHDRWEIDFDALEKRITPRTRAVIVVHPNNPTGSFVSENEADRLRQLCALHGLTLILDEVFLDYAFTPNAAVSFAGADAVGLTFVLSGISKVCALPQMKCSWIVMRGPMAALAEARRRLEIIADTFLSMNAPVQHALPQWLATRRRIQAAIRARCASNLARMHTASAVTACTPLPVEAGWNVIVRVPEIGFARRALEAGVLVQPGEFYGLGPAYIVLSLLTPPELWVEGLARLTAIAV